MKVLIVGGGGREHALAWKISQSPSLEALYCAPGNPGMAAVAEIVDLKVDQITELAEFAKDSEIDLTVVGPEYPLTLGIVDEFQKRGLRVFGPSMEAARIEGSKAFAKEVMQAAAIPTAGYGEFTGRADALKHLEGQSGPIVVKLDGLAAGKGVYVCQNGSEAREAIAEIYDSNEKSKIIIEEFLEGKEASYIVATDGVNIVPMASSHDYKRIFDGDAGPNTGGMGTVSPTPNLTAEQEEWALENVMRPAIAAMEKMGKPYRGFLYAGLMISPSGDIKVLEFNARMGDPEGQVILRRLEGDLAALLFQLSDPQTAEVTEKYSWSKKSAVCVVLASEGYPQSPVKGDLITGIEQVDGEAGCVVFHAGTAVAEQGGGVVTSGGRVLNVTCLGENLEDARKKTYEAAASIKFRGMQFRNDIAKVQ